MIYTIEYSVGLRTASGGWNQGALPRQTPSQSSVFWYQLEIWLNVIAVKASRQLDGECFGGQHVNDNWNNLTQSTNENSSLKTNSWLSNIKFPLFMEPRDYRILYTPWYCSSFLILSFHLFLGLPSHLIKLLESNKSSSHLQLACYFPRPYNPPWFDRRNNISLKAKILSSRYEIYRALSVRYKVSSQNPSN